MPVLAGDPTAAALGSVGNRGRSFWVEVDAFDVEKMLDIVMARLSGYNLSLYLRERAFPVLRDEVMDRFASEGDSKSGPWDPLTDTTQDIRSALGYPPAHPINVRSSEMMNFLRDSRQIRFGEDWAEMDYPGDTDDPVLERKLQTAQEGSTDNPLGYRPTPPRPVLAEPGDMEVGELLEGLQAHVMLTVAGVLV